MSEVPLHPHPHSRRRPGPSLGGRAEGRQPLALRGQLLGRQGLSRPALLRPAAPPPLTCGCRVVGVRCKV